MHRHTHTHTHTHTHRHIYICAHISTACGKNKFLQSIIMRIHIYNIELYK